MLAFLLLVAVGFSTFWILMMNGTLIVCVSIPQFKIILIINYFHRHEYWILAKINYLALFLPDPISKELYFHIV